MDGSKPTSSETHSGLICKKCGHDHFRVVYTRRGADHKIVRRRECRHCRTRITTWERMIGE